MLCLLLSNDWSWKKDLEIWGQFLDVQIVLMMKMMIEVIESGWDGKSDMPSFSLMIDLKPIPH